MSGGAPRVTVVVATHQRPALLARALASLAAQTAPVEVVVVNDAGIDVTHVLEQFPGLNVRLVTHEINQGRSAAYNTGLAACRTEFVGFLNDDDLYSPEHVAVSLEALDRLGPGVAVHTHAYRVTESLDGTEIERKLVGEKDSDASSFEVANYIPNMCLTIPAEAIRAVGGFDTDFDQLEDWDCWLRLREQVRFVHVPVATAEYRMRRGLANATTREWYRFHDALLRVYAKHPVPPHSKLALQRARFLSDNAARGEKHTYVLSIVIACDRDPAALLATLENVSATLGESSFEVLIMVPEREPFQELLGLLDGDVFSYRVGAMTAEEAFDFSARRSAGRLRLLLLAGEHLDVGVIRRTLEQPPGTAVRAGAPVTAGVPG
jgi:GT2 family glycosyltransferase